MNFHRGQIPPLIVSALFLPFATGLAAQAPGTKDVAITLKAIRSDPSGVTCLSYSVANALSNSGNVDYVSVDVSARSGEVTPSNEGLVDGYGASTQFSQIVLSDPRTVPMNPVALSAPIGWTTSLATDGTAVWTPVDNDLRPGQIVEGLELCTRGLLGIRVAAARPTVDVDDLSLVPPNGTAEDLRRYKKELESIEASVGTTVQVVGPVGAPINFNPREFFGRILSYNDIALQRRWIRVRGVSNSFESKLRSALAAFNRNDVGAARNLLEALLHEVDAQETKALSLDAAALLRSNVRYLLDRM